MKNKILFLFLGVILCGPLRGQYEEAAIRELLREAYVNGAYNEGILRNMELGFSPHFRSISLVDGENKIKSLNTWMNEVERAKAANQYPREKGYRITLHYHRIEINGNQANVKVNRMVGGKPVAIEYFDLFKYGTGWLIVNLSYSGVPGGPAPETAVN
ncbi:MAG: nuclear transport factor 2 family protein [Owenweeksia sp.]|nr:nuclear transport factor 2 family protein [Owenweeksia sp.]